MGYVLRRSFEGGEERHITSNGTKHLIGGGIPTSCPYLVASF